MASVEENELAKVLSLWRRKVARMPAATVATTLRVAPSTLSNWETGTRRPSRATIKALDATYHAHGALADFTWAVTTPSALAPGTQWRHNFVPAGGPVWAWIRPSGDTRHLDVRIRWGPLGITIRQGCDHQGIGVVLPVSVTTPPAIADLETPGWVDFGHGHLPEALGIPIVAAWPRLEVLSPADHSLRMFTDTFNRHARQPLSHLLRDQPLLAAALSQAQTPPRRTAETLGAVTPISHGVSGARLRQLREARGLSQSDAAVTASVLIPRSPVSDDQIGLAEAGGTPRSAMLIARLDVVYQARGTITNQRLDIRSDPSGHTVTIPQWWDGPIWMSFTNRHNHHNHQTAATITLRWPPWKRELTVEPGATVTFCNSPGNHDTLHVTLPMGWHPIVGLGSQPQAHPVDDGWQPADLRAQAVIARRYLPLYLQLAGQNPADLLRLLTAHPAT